MPSIGEFQPPGNIMVVDDNPANLQLLEEMLLLHEYDVRSFPLGRLALAAAEQEPPDLILLDINMPEMSGYEVCQQLKSNKRLSEIPVIFLSALTEIDDKIKGFRCGGIDYISKPFQFEEVQARVETHVQLRRARQAEHDLLERTLRGAVDTLWELVQLTSPTLASRSRAIRDVVIWIARRMDIKTAWQCELAATLCLVGCITLPDEVFGKGYSGQYLTPEEQRMFQAHPERAASLLAKIPRLDGVAAMIQSQQRPGSVGDAALEAGILQLAMEFDRKIYRGMAPASALAELRWSRRFDSRALDALGAYTPADEEYDVRRIPIRELRVGMILESDVISMDGNLLILKQGTVLTETWLERLENFSRVRGAQEFVNARVPRVAGRQ
jgi:DNA-binding response OmpR family regulator